MKKNGVIVPLAFPDTLIKKAETRGSKAVQIFSKKGVFKVGHAALLLIKNGENKIHYFDFGRYITPPKHGRVRSEITDFELNFPIRAMWNETNTEIINKENILSYLQTNPDKTHGNGRLIASFCYKINFEKAHNYIKDLMAKDFILYGIFGKKSTNCSRFVANTIYNSTTSKNIKLGIDKLRFITPSPVGIVLKSNNKEVFEVEHGIVKKYTKNHRWEMIKNFILKDFDVDSVITKEEPTEKSPFKNANWLGGIGDGAWYSLEHLKNNVYIGKKTNSVGKHFEDEFITDDFFDSNTNYEIIYPSNNAIFTVLQNGKKIIFRNKNSKDTNK